MRHVALVFTLAALGASSGVAQEKTNATPPSCVESLDAVKREYAAAAKAFSSAYRAALTKARDNGTAKGFKFDEPSPGPQFSRRFLAIAENDPEGPDALDALTMVLQTSFGRTPGTSTDARARAVRILRQYYAAKPSIKCVISLVARLDDADSKNLARDIVARNPDRKIQALVIKGQIASLETAVRFLDVIKDPERRASIEASTSEAIMKERIAKAETARSEIDHLKKILLAKYGDIIADLSIGRAAPEIVARDLCGDEVRLSALKGKVVVIDIWATWCGPCKAMIPHERKMVDRFKDKPFVLVSISADENKETLTEFLAGEKMPWTHWWNGSKGGILEDWDVQYFPTVYVLDEQGVIRFKDIRGEELEKAVNALLEEMKSRPA